MLQFMGSQRVGCDLGLNNNSNDMFIYIDIYMFIYNLNHMSYILFSCNRYSVLYMFYKFYVHICTQKFVCTCV